VWDFELGLKPWGRIWGGLNDSRQAKRTTGAKAQRIVIY